MIEPLPNCFSICARAAVSALFFWSSIVVVPVVSEAVEGAFGAPAGPPSPGAADGVCPSMASIIP